MKSTDADPCRKMRQEKLSGESGQLVLSQKMFKTLRKGERSSSPAGWWASFLWLEGVNTLMQMTLFPIYDYLIKITAFKMTCYTYGRKCRIV